MSYLINLTLTIVVGTQLEQCFLINRADILFLTNITIHIIYLTKFCHLKKLSLVV